MQQSRCTSERQERWLGRADKFEICSFQRCPPGSRFSGGDPVADVRMKWQQTGMTDSSKLLFNVGSFVACLTLAAYVSWSVAQSKLAADNFKCTFDAVSTENAFSFGNLKQPIKSISLAGFIDDPFDAVLHRFAGDALITTEGETIEAAARGSVFVDDSGDPIGIMITLENERFGQDWLSITTLRDDGVLDYNQSQAFLYSDQARGDPFRLTYPVTMRCEATLS